MSRRQPQTSPSHPARTWGFFVLGVVVATLLAYRPAWHGGLLWDDEGHLIPVALRSWEGLGGLWLDPSLSQQYYPVTSTVFWFLAQVGGDAPVVYHLTSILLHAAAAVLFTMLLTRLGIPGARLAGVIFALHPVHVESVAWMSEIKNTLSVVWYLLAAWCYTRFDDDRLRVWYAAAALAFLLALGSKTVTATWPAAILVILWWRRGALRWRADVLPLVPFFVVGIAAGVGTAWIEYHQIGAQGDQFAISWVERGLLAGRVVWFYVLSLVWPHPLVFSYPRWTVDATLWWQWLYPAGMLVALFACVRWRATTRGPLAAALLFIGVLFPVLGFLNVYPFRYSYVADHFQYHASLAAIAAIAAGLTLAAQRWTPRLPAWVVLAAVGLPLWLLTSAQSRLYVDAPTLYRHTLVHNPTSSLALTNLASLLLEREGDGLIEAMALTERAVQHHPNEAVAHNLHGLGKLKAGLHQTALESFDRAAALDPRLSLVQYNRGLALDGLNRLEEAAAAYEAALALTPDSPLTLHNLAVVLRRLGRPADALTRIEQAVALDPQSPDLRLNLADTRQATGDLQGAVETYRQAIALRPEWGEAWNNLGVTLRMAGRHAEAADAFRSAVRLVPQVPMVHINLASALMAAGRPGDAIAALETANTMFPGVPQLQSALAQARKPF
jgi:tetratricopeptide (TPR) repeat protein